MSSTLYSLFMENVFKLVETMVVKHHESAQKINEIVLAKGYQVSDDPSTWKYYLNLAGEYHQSDLDDINIINGGASDYMQIKIASDTGSVNVDFTKTLIDPINGNISIANEYQYGSYYYNELLTKYPDFEELILGILTPIPLSVSINSDDNTILYMGGYYREIITDTFGTRSRFVKQSSDGLQDSNLIEDNETSVIVATESFIINFIEKWHNVDYVKNHNLYVPVLLATLYSKLPGFIVSERLKRAHTPEAHSFLIREYFESNGRLSKYVAELPLKQRLYLYRNLTWLQNNVGARFVFNELVNNVATPCRVPLSRYSLRHNLTHVPEEILPRPTIRREVVNFRQAGSSRDANDINTILIREIPLARDNSYNLANVELEIEEDIKYSQNNRLPTKIVESQMIDYTDLYVYPLSRFLFDMWLYKAANNTYTGAIYVTNPSTGDRLSLTPRNALILALFCYNKGATGNDLVNIPVINAFMVPREVDALNSTFPGLPTAIQLKSKLDSDYITLDICQRLLGSLVVDNTINSSDAFYTETVKIYSEFKRRYVMAVKHLDIDARAQMEFGVSQLYWLNLPCSLSSLSYSQWFAQTGISIGELTPSEYLRLADNIVKLAIGNRESSSDKLGRLQNAVIEIIKHFSSYTVQFISSLNDSNGLVYEPKTIRGSNITTRVNSSGYVPIAKPNLINVAVSNTANYNLGFGSIYQIDE